MMTASLCDCLVCQLESRLIAEFSDDQRNQEFRRFAAPSPTLSSFPTAFELIRSLHDYDDNHNQNPSSDEVLMDLVRRDIDMVYRPMWQDLLLLVFIPTVHRTTSQITSTFALLTRDDTAQHIFACLLEFLRSDELRARRSHLAFIVARKIRRSAFRWAIRESHRSLRDETLLTEITPARAEVGEEFSRSNGLLRQFLDSCQRRGWLSAEERELLTQFKLEGVSGKELARRNGHSAVAIRHRIQRVLARLRRVARTSPEGKPEQLHLFPL
jgi:DNA-directed RNA polymerase specialized sigma24 family protein